jgi:hypothetical protein
MFVSDITNKMYLLDLLINHQFVYEWRLEVVKAWEVNQKMLDFLKESSCFVYYILIKNLLR